jgi:hypothetical protein
VVSLAVVVGRALGVAAAHAGAKRLPAIQQCRKDREKTETFRR